MKILHTSDWHLGHTLYTYDREEEQKAMIEQIMDIISTEQPDVFLLCGDVYHTAQPSSAVQTMFTEAMVALHNTYPAMTIVITAGNHDSATKHEIFRTPWKFLNIHTIGSLNKEDIGEHIIEVPGKGFIIAVPYAYERNLPDGFFQQVLDAAAERNTEGLPVILTAHTTVKGCDFSGHSLATEYTVGGIDSFDIEQMGSGYDYLALGHIHHEQFVHTGKHNVRYSGTPIAISFDENYAHSVSIVQIEKHGDKPEVHRIEINNPRPLVTLPTEGWASWDDAKQLLVDFPRDIPAYIRLNVEIEDHLPPQANAEAMTIAKEKQCRFCLINTHRREMGQTEHKTFTIEEFQAEDPIDIAKHYASEKDFCFDEDMEALFKEVLNELNEESRND